MSLLTPEQTSRVSRRKSEISLKTALEKSDKKSEKKSKKSNNKESAGFLQVNTGQFEFSLFLHRFEVLLFR